MKLTDFFDCTYIINLPDRKDRRVLILKELEKNYMALTPGKIEIFPGIRPKEAAGFPNIGVRGCFLSHLSILKLAKERGLKNVLVMEDDLKISYHFKEVEKNIVEQLSQTDWGFVYLGHREKCEEVSSNVLQRFSKPIVTAHFYGVNGTIFDRLISHVETIQTRPPGHPEGGPMHLDGAYSRFRSQNPDVLTLIACPNLGLQQPSRSDLQGKWFDKLPVIKEAVDLVRALKRIKY